jgi:hypothetical protein
VAVPTHWKRIAVTEDPELAEALNRVAPFHPGVPPARLVHDLAIKGAKAVEEERRRSAELIEEAIAISTDPDGPLDRAVLQRIDELAWGE